jgi:hypothetical protein
MIIQIEVQPETAGLIAQAQMQGVSIDALLHEVLEANEKGKHFQETATPEEWENALRQWAGSHTHITAPPLSDESLRRENIYTREDDML